MEKVKLMNMCRIINRSDNTTLFQKRIKSWVGLSFPGGKVEAGEGIVDSVIREIKEETGLKVFNLRLKGIKNWYSILKNERGLVFLFETEDYTGDLLKVTDEGENRWLLETEVKMEELAPDFSYILDIYNNDDRCEMIYQENKDVEGWVIK